MAEVASHGGECCGIYHIMNFPDDDESFDEGDVIHLLRTRISSGKLVEIVLNQAQCEEHGDLLSEMADLGFVVTSAFSNSSGSHCFVFHRCDTRLPINDLPFEWTGQLMSPTLAGNLQGMYNRPVADIDRNQRHTQDEAWMQPERIVEAPRPLRRVILTQYRNVFRNGNTGGYYNTIEVCRAKAPRCQRIDKIEYYNDGTTNITENYNE